MQPVALMRAEPVCPAFLFPANHATLLAIIDFMVFDLSLVHSFPREGCLAGRQSRQPPAYGHHPPSKKAKTLVRPGLFKILKSFWLFHLIAEPAVKSTGLPIMAALADGAPVGLVHEQPAVTTVGNHMIQDCGAAPASAQWVRQKKSCPLPSILRLLVHRSENGPALALPVLVCMLCAMPLPNSNQQPASGMCTRFHRTLRHLLLTSLPEIPADDEHGHLTKPVWRQASKKRIHDVCADDQQGYDGADGSLWQSKWLVHTYSHMARNST